jgi:hypothetical protein
MRDIFALACHRCFGTLVPKPRAARVRRRATSPGMLRSLGDGPLLGPHELPRLEDGT